jgi:hypothetical protein
MLNKVSLALLVILAGSYFFRNSVRFVTDIAPEILQQPSQESVAGPGVIEFEKDSYRYTLSPVAKYTISGLVVSKKNYRLFSIYKTDSVFPYDICLIWGSNVQSGVFRDQAVRFSQDCRWCNVEWSGNIVFDLKELSNNHVLINDPDIERTVKSLVAGDQVMITGKLVNVKALLTGKGSTYDAPSVEWRTSTRRTDQGAGACEIIYVENIQVLRSANVPARVLFSVSLYGLCGIVLWKIYRFFR